MIAWLRRNRYTVGWWLAAMILGVLVLVTIKDGSYLAALAPTFGFGFVVGVGVGTALAIQGTKRGDQR